MKINSVLDKVIKVLLVSVISIMLTIGLLFVTPVYVHAEINNTFYKVPVNTDPDQGLYVGSFVSSGVTKDIYISATGDGVSAAAYINGSTKAFYILSKSSGKSFYYSPSNLSNWSQPKAITTNYNSQAYYLSWSNSSFEPSDKLPVFSDHNTLMNAFVNAELQQDGQFYSLPQVGSSVEIDYSTVAAQGAFVYANNSTYSLLGQYSTEVSPTSQYCYVQTGTDAYTPVVFSSVPLTTYNAFINGQTYSYFVCSEYDNGKYCYSIPLYATLEELSPCVPFENLTAAKEAFAGASSGGGAGSASGVASAGAITLDVPAGNVLYVKPRAGSQARLEVTYPYPSNNSSPYWGSSAKWLSGVSSLPSEGVTMPLSGMSNILWSVDDSVTDPQGRSYNGYTTHAPFNVGWFVVWNPLYYNVVSADGGNTNRLSPTITVNMQYALEYHIYPLTENVVTGVTTSKTDYDTGWNGEYDPDNDIWDRDSSGVDTEVPVVGGQQSSTIGQTLSIGDYLHQIGEVLTSFANNFISLLTAPIAHIQQLIAAGSTFMSSIGQFFTWLPEPVYQILVTALILVIVIGVIKLLFK